MKKILIILSLFFVIFSFSPSLYEIYQAKNIPKERTFVLEHNYMFDYNFYLSRTRQGLESKWLVVEKYYNLPHQGSLFQIFYLLAGKVGSPLGISPPVIYHSLRLLIGLILLMLTGYYVSRLMPGWWQAVSYLFIVTAGSWPILVKAGGGWRFATYMGWWSAVDSLQRITFLPHVVLGQIFILLFVWRFGREQNKLGSKLGSDLKVPKGLTLASDTCSRHPLGFSINLLIWGMVGFLAGIIFPPTLVVVYTVFGILSVMEFGLMIKSQISNLKYYLIRWLKSVVTPRLIFILLSLPSFIYLQLMFKVLPWSALALFDIQHRIGLPYKEYFLALGPILPLGIIGGIAALFKSEKKLFPSISWVLSIFLLFKIFENVPTQSPLRFTEAAIHIPLGILAVFLLQQLWRLGEGYRQRGIKIITGIMVITVILLGLGVMGSMVGWLTDQAKAKGQGTWLVPIGAQLVYPLKDFMDGIYYLRDNTRKDSVVLTYVTAGNFIPAYSGNFVYIGHANTPDEDSKEKITARFFSGGMNQEEAKEFLRKERISYVFFGPQEREVGGLKDLSSAYQFISQIYSNSQVTIYRVENL